jgi:hypothetical protein
LWWLDRRCPELVYCCVVVVGGLGGDVLVDVFVKDLHVVFVGVEDSEDGFQRGYFFGFSEDALEGSSALAVLLELVGLSV